MQKNQQPLLHCSECVFHVLFKCLTRYVAWGSNLQQSSMVLVCLEGFAFYALVLLHVTQLKHKGDA